MTATAAELSGPLALVVEPDGSARTLRLPDAGPHGGQHVHDLVGGWLEAITGRGWCAYFNEDGERERLPVNMRATGLACALGWRPHVADWLLGVVVFLGRDGTSETDVPERALQLARETGVIDE